ncbi:MAG: hypothetical protein Q8M33_13640 [Hydrogenophaga sp.]|nr:hypothetical protein [Hydrogenophaga sp.]
MIKIVVGFQLDGIGHPDLVLPAAVRGIQVALPHQDAATEVTQTQWVGCKQTDRTGVVKVAGTEVLIEMSGDHIIATPGKLAHAGRGEAMCASRALALRFYRQAHGLARWQIPEFGFELPRQPSSCPSDVEKALCRRGSWRPDNAARAIGLGSTACLLGAFFAFKN